MELISSKEVLKNKLFTITEELARDPDGFEIHRFIVRHPGSAVMLAVDEEDRMLLVRQFRLPAGKELWELPAGRLDPGESPLESAQRELREETGYLAKTWTHLVTFWPSPGYVGEKMDIFLARDLTAGPQNLMDDERIRFEWFSVPQIREMIRNGEIEDGKTLIGFYSWQAG
jgi:ADP-ribose pyrophosphatase